ncbi:MAG TPA: acyl-ACP--UDP-N-acetylglucosamine O-acyltransferase [Candidatus Kapabacteria bacterium]|nr:acyl-ACP--UDP-N-acetylglucosamine O-acyltransferase [Candidatus Kapabacteria bacterium]HPO63241.1 acyl-ACP--UDP-N-acetylglucosamine O-acyltransferase [Candidatus Kapabacteria bacterium]
MNEVIIHPTAIVSPKAELGKSVKIGAFSIIEDDVIIGDNTEIRSSVVIANGARIGKDCKIYSNVIISTEPQDLKFEGEETYVFIGDRNVIREFATINRATKETGKTVIGNDNLLMAYTHVAHDCVFGNNIIMSNVSQIAGHVHIEDWVIFGAYSKVHQFCTVGKHSMLAAGIKIVKDVPPFVLIGREPAKIEGINKIGLRRRGFSQELIDEIEIFYNTILNSGMNNKDGIAEYSKKENIPDEIKNCIQFIEDSKRGIHR